MKPIIAELTVQDVDASIYWYRELGFSVDGEGLRDEDGLQWVSLSHGGRLVWLLRADLAPDAGMGPPRVRLYLPVDGIDAIYERLAARGIATEGAPQNQWYGLREFSVRDPDGFRWVLNEPLPEDETPPPPRGGALPGLA